MQKRYLPILVFAAIAAAVAIGGYIIPETVPKNPERILLDNAAGKVVFNHQKHFEDYGFSCATCHHEMILTSETVENCGSCHGVAFDETFRTTHVEKYKSFNSCATCHHMEFAPKVDWTHKAHAEEYGLDCTSCHHEDTSIEPEPQNCADCHQESGDESMPSLRDAVHVKCQSCHEDMFDEGIKGCASCHTTVDMRKELKEKGPKVFKVSEKYASCAVCHTDQKMDELIPGRMNAFHGQCITCHQEVEKGPYTQEQCAQCHL